MQDRKFQIKLLSKSGELLRCINCFGGQVTVFRAVSSSALQPFQRALAGIPGPEKIVITLDGESYTPEMAKLIGFGESMATANVTVADYLQEAGMPAGSIQASLLAFGLDGIAESTCQQLSKDQERRLTLIAATAKVDNVLIINNPFEDISSQWRERFAEHILAFARNNRQIVVIPSLSYRPESWIDNELIARVQVGENLQRTIGFGSDPSQMNEVISQVRAMFKDEEEAKKALESVLPGQAKSSQAVEPVEPPNAHTETPLQAWDDQKLTSPKSIGIEYSRNIALSSIITKPASGLASFLKRSPAISFAIFAAILVVFVALLSSEKTTDGTKIASKKNPPTKEISQQIPDEFKKPPIALAGSDKPTDNPADMFKKLIAQQQKRQQEQQPPKPFTKPVKHAYVLPLYPSSIQKAILSTFNGDAPVHSSSAGSKAPDTMQVSDDHSPNLFSMLESTSGTGDKLPATAPSRPSTTFGRRPVPEENVDLEERRERIRQKFLDAIKRASENR
ncbi:hypothetical protein OAO01_09400 [Oligoflexia bacterium]|nr:hypothetical protein [Oligoflexia bacterium]